MLMIAPHVNEIDPVEKVARKKAVKIRPIPTKLESFTNESSKSNFFYLTPLTQKISYISGIDWLRNSCVTSQRFLAIIIQYRS